jgi:hypothetical protein
MACMLNISGLQWAVNLSDSQTFCKWGQELQLIRGNIELKPESQVEKENHSNLFDSEFNR